MEQATLDSLERDSSIISVFVGCHHPPFTNNTIVGGSADVRNQYVPPFLHHAKCKLFLSGHANAFEHFQKSGKDFVVWAAEEDCSIRYYWEINSGKKIYSRSRQRNECFITFVVK